MKRMEICQMAHENAQRKGFWAEKMSNEHYLMLICTEIAELVEADRTNKVSEPIERFRWLEDWYQGQQSSDNYNFHNYFKNTVEDEFADIYIRLADLAGALGVDFEKMSPCRYFRAFNKFSFTENAFALVKGLSKDKIGIEKRIQFGLDFVEEWAKEQGVNLGWHITQKMKYNQLRESLHGKKY